MATSPIHNPPLEYFKDELDYYEKNKDWLLKNHLGQYALIMGREFISIFSSSEDAYRAGIVQFGRQPFLIKHIAEKEEPAQIPALFTGLIGADF